MSPFSTIVASLSLLLLMYIRDGELLILLELACWYFNKCHINNVRLTVTVLETCAPVYVMNIV